MKLEVKDLTFIYQKGIDQTIFANMDLSVNPGQKICITGPSGVGKTTLMKLLAGLLAPNAGKILYGDFHLNGVDERSRTIFRRENIGLIFQDFRLIDSLTVYENIVLPMQLNNVDRDKQRLRAHKLLSDVNMENYGNIYPDQLSGGQQQRIAIAVALANDPKIILADEPTGNLDRENSKIIIDLLDSLITDDTRILIICSHDNEIINKFHTIYEIINNSVKLVE